MLPGISTEQLRSRLNRMVADGLLTRQRYREVPPRVDYELTPRSRELLPVLGALARWGLEWAWTAPREGEAIDIGAILRVAPGLVSRARRRHRHRRAQRRARRTASPVTTRSPSRAARRRSPSSQRPTPPPAIAGSEADWIEALGPAADRAGSADHRRRAPGHASCSTASARPPQRASRAA